MLFRSPGIFLPGFTQTGQLFREEIELERQRQEVQEAQRRVQGQREALLLQQKEQEEDLREQWRRQKEALDALLSANTQVTRIITYLYNMLIGFATFL